MPTSVARIRCKMCQPGHKEKDSDHPLRPSTTVPNGPASLTRAPSRLTSARSEHFHEAMLPSSSTHDADALVHITLCDYLEFSLLLMESL